MWMWDESLIDAQRVFKCFDKFQYGWEERVWRAEGSGSIYDDVVQRGCESARELIARAISAYQWRRLTAIAIYPFIMIRRLFLIKPLCEFLSPALTPPFENIQLCPTSMHLSISATWLVLSVHFRSPTITRDRCTCAPSKFAPRRSGILPHTSPGTYTSHKFSSST